jgi:hypothetical protein
MFEVITTDEFAGWYEVLDEGHAHCVYRAVTQLEAAGVALPFPLSSAIVGSSVALRELRGEVRAKM